MKRKVIFVKAIFCAWHLCVPHCYNRGNEDMEDLAMQGDRPAYCLGKTLNMYDTGWLWKNWTLALY